MGGFAQTQINRVSSYRNHPINPFGAGRSPAFCLIFDDVDEDGSRGASTIKDDSVPVLPGFPGREDDDRAKSFA